MENLSIMEEKEELMVPFNGSNDIPTLRVAHFLKPSSNLTLNPFPPKFSANITEQNNERLQRPKVEFKGRRYPQKGWKEWVDQMRPRYQHIWKKVGIFDAIVASTYKVYRDNDLVLKLAEHWCEVTNTFIFEWGEATITLEDMMVLGGFSVLGSDSVSLMMVSDETCSKDFVEKLESLNMAYRDVCLKIKQGYAYDGGWIRHFKGRKHPLQHAAFLSLWLSTFVFPMKHYCIVGKHVFPLAIHLSMGTQIALAPAVLASIYRDLSLLKKAMVNDDDDDESTTIRLWAPFQLVQLWAWERFPSLGPTPNALKRAEPRAARWHRLSITKVNVHITKIFDFPGESFQWRPYTVGLENWEYSKFYWKSEKRVLVESDVDMKLESFARCLRDSELVGMDCVEHYLPHRVAMQFGFDQDVPSYASMPPQPAKIAWDDYIKPIKYSGFYIPPRLLKSDVTAKYVEWFNQMTGVSVQGDVVTNESLAEEGQRMEVEDHIESVDQMAFPGSEVSSSSAILGKNVECLNDVVTIMMESGNVAPEEDVQISEYKPEEGNVDSAATHGKKDECTNDVGADVMESENVAREKNVQFNEEDKLEEETVECECTNDVGADMMETENVAQEVNVQMREEDKLEEEKVEYATTFGKKDECSNDVGADMMESGNVQSSEEEGEVESAMTHVDGTDLEARVKVLERLLELIKAGKLLPHA